MHPFARRRSSSGAKRRQRSPTRLETQDRTIAAIFLPAVHGPFLGGKRDPGGRKRIAKEVRVRALGGATHEMWPGGGPGCRRTRRRGSFSIRHPRTARTSAQVNSSYSTSASARTPILHYSAVREVFPALVARACLEFAGAALALELPR